MQTNKTYIYARNKHPFASYPAAKHPNASNLRLQTYDKKQWSFYYHHTGVDFSSRMNFPSLDTSAKVSIPVKMYNSLLHLHLYPIILITIVNISNDL